MFAEVKPMLQTVRFASIEIDRTLTPSPLNQSTSASEIGGGKSNDEVDLSTLIAQAQKQNDEERSISSTETVKSSINDFDTYTNKWDSQVPATAFGGIVRFEDDTFDYKTISTRLPKNKKSPLNRLINLPQPPKTAPLPPSQSKFQPFEDTDDLAILPNQVMTPQTQLGNQTPFLQQPPKTSTNQYGLYLSSTEKANLAHNKPQRLLSSADQVNNVKSHLEGLSIHLSGLFDQVKEVEELKKEVKYWKDVCLGLEIGKKDLENLVAQTQKEQFESAFSVVIIEGDNRIFHSRLLQAGFEGGQEAANLLTAAAQHQTGVNKVVIQVFLNKSTLGATLIKNGVIQTWAKYDQFWQGFSSSGGLITVCDLGSGGAGVREKVEEYLQLYNEDAQCGHIYLAADDYTPTSGYTSDKTVLLNQPGDFGLTTCTSQPSIEIADVFESVQLVPLTARPLTQQTNTDNGSVDQIEVYEWSSFNSNENDTRHKNRNNIKISSGSGNDISAGQWDDLSPMRKFRKPTKYNKVAAEQVRKLDPRPCHTHYLSEWGCRDVDACSYGHSYHLSSAQLGELARMAKSVICPYMKDGRCRYDDDECVYGHVCPNASKCPFRESCRFRAIPNGHGELD